MKGKKAPLIKMDELLETSPAKSGKCISYRITDFPQADQDRWNSIGPLPKYESKPILQGLGGARRRKA
ncbi:hypothetical protein WMW72_10725 [Paenibacillus filicis]|uniref:Uncharacterized protein n=1 Tax=Paenibacillus filicis TaxID=669464 RepID=A0ABU9DHP1_9BACL